MKTTPRQLLFGAALACFGMLTFAAMAESAPPPAQTGASVAETASSAPAPTATSSVTTTTDDANHTAPTAQTAPEAAAAPAAATVPPTAVAPQTEAAPQPTPAPAAPAEAQPTSEPSLRALDTPAVAAEDEQPAPPQRARSRRGGGGGERVSLLNNATLGKDERAEVVVAVLGNATSEGEVSDAVVAVLGNVRVTGPVGDSVVAVLGNVYVDSRVGEVVSVGGNVELGPNAEVMGDVVDVGGTVKRDPKAVVHGEIPNVQISPFNLGNVDWLHAYITQCLAKGRILAFAPHLGWAWTIALGFLVFYVLLAMLFRGGVEKTVSTLETRPGSSILAALLTLLLTPVLIVLLCITVVGIAVVPFLGVALMCAGLFGKATMLAWLGRRITRLFGDGPLAHPAFAVLIGGVLVLLLYTVPVVGFVLYKLLGIVGLGVVVYTVLLASKRSKPPVVAAAAMPASAPGLGFVPSTDPAGMGAATMVAEPVVAAPPVTGTALPRAGFWIRTAALVIDVILVWVVLGISSAALPRPLHFNAFSALLPVLAAYAAVLWKIRSTTIGGIICGLRVVRLDNRAIDWPTAVVRALSCFLSLFVIGLGFIWTAIDDEKQSWHDKIAGTTVVFARGTTLV